MRPCSLGWADLEDLRGLPLEPIDPHVYECSETSGRQVLEQTPKVSVLILAYNHGPYLKQTLEGVIGQKAPFPFEAVIAEDCSTDDTRDIALAYQRQYPGLIRVLWSSANVGASANAYRAIRHCRGEYIACCEGDDFWHAPEKMRRQVEVLEKYPNVGLVFSGGRLSKGESVRTVKGWGRGSALLSEGIIPAEQGRLALLRRAWHPLTCSCMFRRESLEAGYRDNPLFTKKLALGDTLTWFEIFRTKDAYYFDEDWVTQMIHEGSATDGIGREYVTRDGCMALCWFAAQMRDDAFVREHQIDTLKARLTIASVTRDYAEVGRVLSYCWRKRLWPGWQLPAYMGLALVGKVAWGKRLRCAQLRLAGRGVAG